MKYRKKPTKRAAQRSDGDALHPVTGRPMREYAAEGTAR